MLTVEINGTKHVGSLIVVFSEKEPICVIHEIAPDMVFIIKHGDKGFKELIKLFYNLESSYSVEKLQVQKSATVLEDFELLKKIYHASGSSRQSSS